MTNIEKIKRILDAGHWVKVTYDDGGYIQTFTSYYQNDFSYHDAYPDGISMIRNPTFQDCTIEVIQRIPTPYKAGDKVLVLSNSHNNIEEKEVMVGKVCEVHSNGVYCTDVFDNDKDTFWSFPVHCLAPAFDDEKDTDLNLSGKEVTVTIDGKEYIAVMK